MTEIFALASILLGTGCSLPWSKKLRGDDSRLTTATDLISLTHTPQFVYGSILNSRMCERALSLSFPALGAKMGFSFCLRAGAHLMNAGSIYSSTTIVLTLVYPTAAVCGIFRATSSAFSR